MGPGPVPGRTSVPAWQGCVLGRVVCATVFKSLLACSQVVFRTLPKRFVLRCCLWT